MDGDLKGEAVGVQGALVSGRLVVSLENAIVAEVELAKPATVVGRHPDCDVVIDHPAISGRHAVFRVVDKTVYVEDLASTNGVKVNGLPTSRQVIHHLDLVELGWHKLHFFEDALLAGRVGSLEQTVQDDYERTRLAGHVYEATQPPRPAARGSEVAFDRTQAIGVHPETTAPREAPGAMPPGNLALRMVQGDRPGHLLRLAAANTLLGMTGGNNALVVRRGNAHFLARLSGTSAPKLNGKPIGPGTHAIAAGDAIEVGAQRYEVILQPESP